jgi:hypothetical protein
MKFISRTWDRFLSAIRNRFGNWAETKIRRMLVATTTDIQNEINASEPNELDRKFFRNNANKVIKQSLAMMLLAEHVAVRWAHITEYYMDTISRTRLYAFLLDEKQYFTYVTVVKEGVISVTNALITTSSVHVTIIAEEEEESTTPMKEQPHDEYIH